MKISTAIAWGVLAIVVIVIGIYALQYRSAQQPIVTNQNEVTFYCPQGQIAATFASNSVSLALADGRTLTLPQVRSGSGIRYEAVSTSSPQASTTSTGSGQAVSDTLFESKGSWGQLSENDKVIYGNCVAAHVADAGIGHKAYADQAGTFTFTYPDVFQIVGTEPGYGVDWMTNATTSGMVLAEIELPKSAQPGTNFGDARVTVGVSADPTALAECLTYNPSGGPTTPPASVTIGGLPFVKLESSDAGAGNLYQTTSYRIIRDNQCYALEYTIHSSNIANYPAGVVTAFDESGVRAELESVVQSFTFLQ